MCVAKTCAVPFSCTCVVYVRLFIIWKTWKLRKLRRRWMCYFVLPYLTLPTHLFYFLAIPITYMYTQYVFYFGEILAFIGLWHDMFQQVFMFISLLAVLYIYPLHVYKLCILIFISFLVILFLPLKMHFSQLFYCL